MEFIRNLVPLIDHDGFEVELRSSKKLLKFFQVLRDDYNISTNDLLNKLYDKEYKNKQAFKQLKIRMQERLINYVIIQGVRKGRKDLYAQNRRVCMNLVTMATYLGNINARVAATCIAESTIIRTIKGEFTDLTVTLAVHLYNYYSTSRYDKRKQTKYDVILKKYLDLYDRELDLSRKYSELQSYYSKSVSGMHDRFLPKAIEYGDLAERFLRMTPVSTKLIFSAYMIILIRYEMERDYDKLLKRAEEVCDIIEQRGIRNDVMSYMFEMRKLICYIKLGRYDEVDRISKKYYGKIESGSQNWFVIKMYHSFSKLRSGHYEDVTYLLNEIQGEKSYRTLPSAVIQTWRVIEAYVEFLRSINKVKEGAMSGFRLNRFLNDQTVFSKDKRGLNIAILTIQFLFLLQQRKYSQIIDRAEALKQYCYRYLRKDDTFRSHCFIRMLLMIPKADFNRIRTERYAEPYLTKLRSVPLRISEQTIEVEVIPYEDLWEMTLELLN